MITKLQQSVRHGDFTKTKRAIIATLLLGGLAVPFFLPVKTEAQNGASDSDHINSADALVGTWKVDVTFNPATIPPTVASTFTRLDTYAPGGVMLASNNGPGAGGPASQGNWARVGHLQYAATELRLSFDPLHNFTGTTEIRTSITVSPGGNEFTAEFTTDIYSAGGNPVPLHPAGTFHGTRVAIEPLH
jgi:hypothetical protein